MTPKLYVCIFYIISQCCKSDATVNSYHQPALPPVGLLKFTLLANARKANGGGQHLDWSSSSRTESKRSRLFFSRRPPPPRGGPRRCEIIRQHELSNPAKSTAAYRPTIHRFSLNLILSPERMPLQRPDPMTQFPLPLRHVFHRFRFVVIRTKRAAAAPFVLGIGIPSRL